MAMLYFDWPCYTFTGHVTLSQVGHVTRLQDMLHFYTYMSCDTSYIDIGAPILGVSKVWINGPGVVNVV